jgi:hypothetical protein
VNFSSRQTQVGQITFYALVSLISFLCGLVILALMIWKAEKLTALGLTGNLFYIVLLPLGLAAAGFLFGVLRSYASYRGKYLGGVLELGGPVVGFALVVIGGFVLVPNLATVPLTVYVHGERGPQDLVLRNSGYVVLRLGLESQRKPIGGDGDAYFPAIPANFRGQEVPVWVESEEFEAIGAPQRRLVGPNVDVPVRKKNGRVSGRVQDEKGNAVSGAEVRVAGLSTLTGKAGRFEVAIPGDRIQAELELDVVAPGYEPEHYSAVPNSNEAVIVLKRAR